MAVREYVGARYVPLFADPIEWSNTRTYEPLTIVEHQGNSYTSRQFVPLGIDISNESFWALTGNYNAQVEQYRQEVQAFDGRITDNANAIATINEDLVPIKHSHEFKNAYCLYMSDSWGTRNYGVTLPYMEVMGKILDMSLVNLSVGSTGYIKGGSNNFINRLTAWVTANPDKVADVDYLMVCGSSNDYEYTRAEIETAIKEYVSYALTALPNAQIVVVPQFATPTPDRAGSVTGVEDNVWRKVNVAAIAFGFNNTLERVRVLPNTFYSMRFLPTSTMNSDNVHPTQQGHNYLGKWLAYELLGYSPQSARNELFQNFTIKTYTSGGQLVDTITPSSTYCNLAFENGILTGALNFVIAPTGAASYLRVYHPAFVKQNTASTSPQLGFCTIAGDGGSNTFEYTFMRMEDTGVDITSDDRGAWIRISFFGNRGISAGVNMGFYCLFNMITSYPIAGANS